MIDKNLLLSILVIILIVIIIYMMCGENKIEPLTANYLDEPEIMLLQKYNEDLDDDDTSNPSKEKIHKNAVNYFKVSEFTELVLDIKEKIAGMLINYGRTCREQNGEDKLGDGEYELSLNCITNPQEIEDSILLEVFKIIHKYILDKYHINLNFHAVMFDLYNHLDLLEKGIYPLMYSELYTINGIQYTTQSKIINLVNTNLPVHDVLYTIISRRNIVLDMDTDQNIQYADHQFQ
jgi:hypothetical protein